MTYQTVDYIDPKIFRAYDIRGVVEESLQPNVLYTLGLALGTTLINQGDGTSKPQLIVGRDARLSGPALFDALVTGLLETGCELVDIGIVPTPVGYFACHHLNIPAAVMLTASHNPAEYNGLKIVIDGAALSEAGIQALRQCAIEGNFIKGEGHITSSPVESAYIDRITGDIQLKRPLKVVIDCGNGVTGQIGPQLLQSLGCEVYPLYCDIDGRFPNHHPDPTIPANLQDLITEVKKHGADLGIALDGDGDRVGAVDSEGNIIWPDRQMMLFSRDLLSRHPGATVIFDVKCSRNLASTIEQSGGHPLMWKTGHSLIKGKLRELADALLAGEMSGHIFFKERWYGFDDGLYAAARLIEILSKADQGSTAVFATLPDSVNTPEIKVSVTEEQKFSFMDQFAKQADFPEGHITSIDGIRVDFPDGWGLVRPSNTTPALTLRFEADSQQSLDRIKTAFREAMLTVDSSLELGF